MIDILKSMRKTTAIIAAVSIIAGIFLVIYPEISGDVICYALGAVSIIAGLVSVIRYFSITRNGTVFRYDLAIGLILCGLGLFMVLRTDLIATAIPYVFGLVILVDGFLNVQRAFELNRYKFKYWWTSLLTAILTVALGIIVLFNPLDTIKAMIIFIGVILIYSGAADIYSVFCISSIKKQIEQSLTVPDAEVTEAVVIK